MQRVATLAWIVLLAPVHSCEPQDVATDAGCTEDCLANGFCSLDDDCDVEELCYDSRCFRDSACKDDDDATPCPTSCIGVCANAFSVGYCVSDDDCREGSCRTDDRFCLRDRRSDANDCVGWCVPGCFLAPSYAIDPDTGTCFSFQDSCFPPGFASARSEEGCVPL